MCCASDQASSHVCKLMKMNRFFVVVVLVVAAACFPVGLGKSYNSMIMSHIICHIFGYLMWFLFVFYTKDNSHLPVVVGGTKAENALRRFCFFVYIHASSCSL